MTHKHKFKIQPRTPHQGELVILKCECGDEWMNTRDNLLFANSQPNLYYKMGWLTRNTYLTVDQVLSSS